MESQGSDGYGTLKIICRKWVLEAAEKYIKRDGWKLTVKEARVLDGL